MKSEVGETRAIINGACKAAAVGTRAPLPAAYTPSGCTPPGVALRIAGGHTMVAYGGARAAFVAGIAAWLMCLLASATLADERSTDLEVLDSRYTQVVNTLVRNKKKYSEYRSLAKKIGVEFDRQYSYSQFADIMRAHEVGIAGHYEWLLLSTGGSEMDIDATQRFNQQACGWNMTYYSNHDITVVEEICRSPDRVYAFSRVVKIGKGRRLNLNAEP